MEKTVTWHCSEWDKVGFTCESQCLKCAKVDRSEIYVMSLTTLLFMNELIADGYSDCVYPVVKRKYGNHTLYYHESWDELMPVVSKIFNWYEENKMMQNKAAVVRVSNIGKALSTANIGAVFKQVYRFIEWYNLNQPTNPHSR